MFGARYQVHKTGFDMWPTIILDEIRLQLAAEHPTEKYFASEPWTWPTFSAFDHPELHQSLVQEGKYLFDKSIASVVGYRGPASNHVTITVHDANILPRSKLDSILGRAHERGWEAFKRSIGATEPKFDLAAAA